MKLQLKTLSALVACSMLIYASCKKTSSAPAGPALTPKQVAGQVALNIDQSLFGGLGGVDLSGGIGSAGSFAIKTPGKVIEDLSDPTCGSTVDTTLSVSLSSGDSTVTIAGSLKFTFGCTGGILSTFTTVDNLTIGYNSPSQKFSYHVGENLTIAATDPSSQMTNILVNGSLNSDGSYQILAGSNKGSGTSIFDYTLKSVLAAGDGSGDVLSGTATFNTSGSGPKGNWNYQGTIVFKGNYTAVVTINGSTYTVNLQTGAVS